MRVWIGLFLLAVPVFCSQDDIDLLFLKNLFAPHDHMTFLPRAQGQLRLGRYIVADINHGWRGALAGDVVLLGINNKLLWHWALKMETLADDHNDIYFRLTQVYYATKTGISWSLDPGILDIAWQHRCSHGADRAIISRILIRSGIHLSYDMRFNFNKINLNLKPNLDIYIIGQNNNNADQHRAALGLNSELRIALKDPWYIITAGGLQSVLLAQSNKNLYFISTNATNYSVELLSSVRFAVAFEREHITSDFGLLFSTISDSGIGDSKNKNYNLSFDINFYWQ